MARETVLVDADGTRTLPGEWVEHVVDDGSVPGLVLTADRDGLHAWSPDGTPRWSADGPALGRDALVLDGEVTFAGGTAVVHLDASDGSEVWRADGLLPQSGLATDGRVVVTLAAPPGGSARSDVVGLDVTDGRVVWRVALPGPADWLVTRQGVLAVVTVGGEAATGVTVTLLR